MLNANPHVIRKWTSDKTTAKGEIKKIVKIDKQKKKCWRIVAYRYEKE